MPTKKVSLKFCDVECDRHNENNPVAPDRAALAVVMILDEPLTW